MDPRPAQDRFTVLIVDDESAARDILARLLSPRPEVAEVVAAGSGSAALDLVRSRSPHIMFLDVEMPDISGLDVLGGIEPESVPQVVFVTGHDDHAVPAFEKGAVDYLLKPFSDRRFEQAFQRAVARVRKERQSDLAERVRRLVDGADPVAPGGLSVGAVGLTSERIALKVGSRTELVAFGDIRWIEGAGAHARVHAGHRSLMVRATLDALERELDPSRFLRLHRSAIVNFDRVHRIQRDDQGRCEVVLTEGERIRVSRSGRRILDEHLEA